MVRNRHNSLTGFFFTPFCRESHWAYPFVSTFFHRYEYPVSSFPPEKERARQKEIQLCTTPHIHTAWERYTTTTTVLARTHTRLTRMPLERTRSTIVSTSMPGFRERRSNAVPFATADATRDGSADSVTVLAAAFTVCHSGRKEAIPGERGRKGKDV